MTLSIITINRNNAHGLKKTIESVINQTFKEFEFIVIDGASTDGSLDIIKQYSDCITYWISEPDKGIYNAMNKGISKAKGNYLQFLNSGDCLFQTDTLEKVFAQSHRGDVIYGNAMCVSSEKSELFKPTQKISLSYFYQGFGINHQSSFFKKSFFDKNHLYDENFRIVSDWMNYFSLILRGAIFEYIDMTIVDYDMMGISSDMTNFQKQERVQCLQKVIPLHIKPDYDELFTLRNRIYTDSLYPVYYSLRTNRRLTKRILKVLLYVLSLFDRILDKIVNLFHQ